jgi:hypothetical protein
LRLEPQIFEEKSMCDELKQRLAVVIWDCKKRHGVVTHALQRWGQFRQVSGFASNHLGDQTLGMLKAAANCVYLKI